MSNALAQKLGHSKSMHDNAWFVGVTPRRDPDLVVCVLFEGGEHGQYAARIAAQVIKAFVEKQRAREKDPNLYRSEVAPGLQNEPVASPAVLAAMHADPNAIPAAERRVLSAELNGPQKGAAVASNAKVQRPSAIGHQPSAEVEIAGFWGGDGSDHLHAGRFKVRLNAPMATAVR
jgi:hypothetical protein